jgi:hypothetical protein
MGMLDQRACQGLLQAFGGDDVGVTNARAVSFSVSELFLVCRTGRRLPQRCPA